jgi:hypothetical protein
VERSQIDVFDIRQQKRQVGRFVRDEVFSIVRENPAGEALGQQMSSDPPVIASLDPGSRCPEPPLVRSP